MGRKKKEKKTVSSSKKKIISVLLETEDYDELINCFKKTVFSKKSEFIRFMLRKAVKLGLAEGLEK